MIGAGIAVNGGKGGSPKSLFEGNPGITGTGEVGTSLAVSVVAVSGATVSYQWLGNSGPLPGQTGPTLLVAPDIAVSTLQCAVTLSRGGASETRVTGAINPFFAAPQGPALLADVVLDAGMGPEILPLAPEFTGYGLAFSLAVTPPGVSIDAVTGELTIDTDLVVGGFILQVQVTNPGGSITSDLPVTIESLPQENQVLDFGSGNNGLYRDSSEMLSFLQGGPGSTSWWMAFFTYYDGVSGTGRAWGIADKDVNGGGIRGSAFSSAYSGTVLNNPGVTSGAGWYWVVQVFRHSGSTIYCRMYQNGTTSTEASASCSAATIQSWDRLALGFNPDQIADSHSNYRQCGMCWGTGNPLTTGTGNSVSFADWVYNGGNFRDPNTYDFNGDDAVTLADQVEIGARIDDGLGNNVTTSDLVGTWAIAGTPTWSSLGPPWLGGSLALFSSAAIEDAARDEIDLTYTLAGGAWNAPVVDINRIFVYSKQGFGPLKINGYTTSIFGVALTVTLILSREVYASEEVEIELSDAWLSDANGNSGAIVEEQPVTNNINPITSPDPTLKTGLSMGKIAVAFDGAYEAGWDANGRGWVRDTGSGVTVTERYPASTTQGGLAVSGSEKNPVKDFDNQGFDGRGGLAYVAGLNVTAPGHAPISLVAGDSLVMAYHNPTPRTKYGGKGTHAVYVREYQGLYVTDDITLTAADYVPPLVGFTAATRPAPITGIDVAAIVAALPARYSTTGYDKPLYEIPIRRIERYNPVYGKLRGEETRRALTPSRWTHADGYGEKVCQTMSAAQLVLLASDSTAAQRARVVNALIGHYIQWDSSTNAMTAAGATNTGLWSALVLGDYWVNGGANIPTLLSDYGGLNEGGGAFEIADAAMLTRMTAPHSQPTSDETYPPYNRLRTVQGMDGIHPTWTRSVFNDVDVSNTRYMILHRVSDGQEATVTSTNFNTSTNVSTVYLSGALTPPLAVGDTVYFRAPWTQAVGDYEWRRTGTYTASGQSEQLNGYSPSAAAAYRNLNQWSAEVMVVRALGLMHASFGSIQEYVERANTANIPTSGNDWPTHHPSFFYSDEEAAYSTDQGTPAVADEAFYWASSFWANHWATIKAVTQIV